LKKHLGIWYDWKTEKETGDLYLEAYMPKIIEEIKDIYKKATDNKSKIHTKPGTPGKCLMKHTGEPIKIDEYRYLVGKIMYYTTKLAPELSNAARELASHLSNPGEEKCNELGRSVGYLRQRKNLDLIHRNQGNYDIFPCVIQTMLKPKVTGKVYQEESTQFEELSLIVLQGN
jgi:hypothetical protein